MPQFIDRRLNPRDKSLGNRQRFLRRARDEIKRAVDEAANDRNIRDAGNGGSISIPSRGISEPSFRHSRRHGSHKQIVPGNKDFVVGDRIAKPKSGAGSGGKGGIGQRRGRGRFHLLPVEERVPRYFVRRSGTSRFGQVVTQRNTSNRTVPCRLLQLRDDLQSQRAAHHAQQYRPAHRPASAFQGTAGIARGQACRVGGKRRS